MADAAQEFILKVPGSLFQHKTGVSLDFGGSLIKIVYATEAESDVCFHFRKYSRENREEAFTFLQDLAQRHLVKGPALLTCGLGCNEYHEQLETIFGVEVKNVSELDGLVDGFQFLSNHVNRDEFVYPDDEVADRHMEASKDAFAAIYRSWSADAGKLQIPPFVHRVHGTSHEVTAIMRADTGGSRDIQYPCVITVVGSALVVIRVHKDGTFDFVEGRGAGGRFFLAMGSLLTEAHNYEDLIQLADAGDAKNVNIDYDQLPMNETDPAYNSLVTLDRTCFSFGKAVGKSLSDFKKEDIARSAMLLVAETASLLAQMWAFRLGVKQAYFVGGLCSSQTFRSLLSREMCFRNKVNITDDKTDFMFVKLGGHLSALGVILKSLEVKSEQ